MDVLIICQFFQTKRYGVPAQRLEAEAVKIDGFLREMAIAEY